MSRSSSQTRMWIVLSLAACVGFFAGLLGTLLVVGFSGFSWLFSSGNLDRLSKGADVSPAMVSLLEEESATIHVVEEVAPAVVSILVQKPRGEVYQSSPYGNYFFFPETLSEEEAKELVEIGGGTGFFVTHDGLVVTNKHVLADEEATYMVVTNEGEEFSASIVAIDPFLDIGVLQVQGSDFPTVTFGDSEHIQIGQTVIAIGNSLSEFRNTVTKGVISGIDRQIQAGDFGGSVELIEEAIQTDAAINPGNSGGPLINLFGQVIGMNTAIRSDAQAIGFAIPSHEIQRAVESVTKSGRILRPWLGVRFIALTKKEATKRNISFTQGALLLSGNDPQTEPAVVTGSPAQIAGLQEGDIILAVNGEEITSQETLGEVIRRHEPGETVLLRVWRDGQYQEFTIPLAEYDPS